MRLEPESSASANSATWALRSGRQGIRDLQAGGNPVFECRTPQKKPPLRGAWIDYIQLDRLLAHAHGVEVGLAVGEASAFTMFLGSRSEAGVIGLLSSTIDSHQVALGGIKPAHGVILE